jgi:hypothetical protein
MATEVIVPNIGELAVLDLSGDTKHMWDRSKSAEVDAAREVFKSLKKKGYMIYKAEGRDGSRGEVLSEFDSEAERIIAVPRMVGG